MCEPVVLLGQRLVDAVVEVLVVGEDDVAADIVELTHSSCCQHTNAALVVDMSVVDQLTNPSGVTSVEARPPASSLESTMSHDGPF